MKTILNILKQKKLQFVFLFYILLLLPFLTPLAENLSFGDKIGIFTICSLLFFAILVLSTFISSRLEKTIYSILLTISAIPGAIFLAYLLFAHVLLEQNSVTSLFETNTEESREFVAHYLSIWVIIGVIIYVAIPIIMICKMKSFTPLKIKKYKTIFFSSITLIGCIVVFNQLSRSVYFINFYKTFISYKIRVNNEIKTINARQTQPFNVKQLHKDSIPQTIVLVIGESGNKHHMSLYGYQRKTNPKLEKYSADSTFFVFNNITSPQVHTIPVMRSLFTMTDLEHPEYFTEKASLFELFNRAGFETYLISNQDFSNNYRSSYDILLSLAKHQYNLAKYNQHDDIIIPVLDKTLKENTKSDKFIVIHLIGNHMAYKFRYPKEFIVFNNEKDNAVQDRVFRDKKAKLTIDQYDNSILYNDYVIDSVIKSLEKNSCTKAAMIYLSDHGEELYDYRDFAGHAYEKVSPTMCEVPLIIWMTPKYLTQRQDLVFYIDRPYSLENFIYTASDIGGLTYEGYEDSKSILSPNFKETERYVGEKKYHEIKRKFNELY